jgi:hypothetical protein
MSVTDRMRKSGGSAIVLVMLLLILLSAIGMYVVSLPLPVGQSRRKHELEAVARNMARAGAHAAIARLPEVISVDSPYVRYLPVGRSLTGKYAVTSRRSVVTNRQDATAHSVFEEYVVLSEGTIVEAPLVKHRVRTVIRCSVREGRCRIVQWEDIALP